MEEIKAEKSSGFHPWFAYANTLEPASF